jgi:hypothetical protein
MSWWQRLRGLVTGAEPAGRLAVAENLTTSRAAEACRR